MSNPWPHRSRRFDPETSQYVAVTGDSVADDVAVTWSSALAEAGHSLDEIDACAARVRDGARAACKRLRGERDEARGQVEGLLLSTSALREACRVGLAYTDAVTQQRNAARLELRALEWLTVNDHCPYTAGPRWNVVRSKSAPHVEHVFDSWSAAARALGWEG